MINANTVFTPETTYQNGWDPHNPHYHHHQIHHYNSHSYPPPPPPYVAAETLEPPPSSPNLGPWSTGLFDCFDDFHSCCLTSWCPCVVVGRVGEIVHQGVIPCKLSGALWTLLICACLCSSGYTAWVRYKMRRRLSLEASPCNDLCLHCFCESCAMCQEYRELTNRGYDLSIGWKGNVERHQRMMNMMKQPTVQCGMVR